MVPGSHWTQHLRSTENETWEGRRCIIFSWCARWTSINRERPSDISRDLWQGEVTSQFLDPAGRQGWGRFRHVYLCDTLHMGGSARDEEAIISPLSQPWLLPAHERERLSHPRVHFHRRPPARRSWSTKTEPEQQVMVNLAFCGSTRGNS